MLKKLMKISKIVLKKHLWWNVPTLDEIVEAKFIKLENLQKRTGSFKVRGAINKIMNLSDEEKAKGVIASSAKSCTRSSVRSKGCFANKQQ